jgi:uncharacterized protein YkwD
MIARCVCLVLVLAAPLVVQSTDGLRADLLRRVNELRAKEEVAPLVRNDKLDAAAQKHAENMARQDKYGDDGKNGHILDGKNPKDRVDAEGYQSMRGGENVALIFGVAAGQKALDMALESWVKSPGHYKNIVDSLYDETGLGIAQSKSGKWYYCQTFGKSKK